MTARSETEWIQTFTGKQFWPLDPRSDDICIEDIAHALSLKCRFTGHCQKFYSVAQHCVLVCAEAAAKDESLAAWALLHDAAEAYLPDVARPVKSAFSARWGPREDDVSSFDEIENDILFCVAERFGLPWPMPAAIKHFDTVLLASEKRDLITQGPGRWTGIDGVKPVNYKIIPMTPVSAKTCFLQQFRRYYT